MLAVYTEVIKKTRMNEIMKRTAYLPHVSLSGVTAWCVGWFQKPIAVQLIPAI